MLNPEISHTAADRFLEYVRIDTQSDPDSDTCPSTEKQKDLGRILVEELLEIGLSDAHMDENGYVYATIASNSEKKSAGNLLLLAYGYLARLQRIECKAFNS